MAGRTFVDTNVFVYTADISEPTRQDRAREILLTTPAIVISTQVMNEFHVVATRNSGRPCGNTSPSTPSENPFRLAL